LVVELLVRWLVPLILGVAWLSPTIAGAQQPVPFAGRYTACFRAADFTRPACGTLTLASTTFCGAAHDGYYSVLFDAIKLPDSSRAGLPITAPPNAATFTWTLSPNGGIHLTRIVFRTDSIPGNMRCNESDGSDFEAWGATSGDSIVGAWGHYDHYAGMDTLGTFVLRARR
jgi:hypothetical protein